MMYEEIRLVHAALAIISVFWFAARGGWYLRTGSRPVHWFARTGPHVVDTLLLLSGVTLLALGSWVMLQMPWLQLKLVLLIVYILLGVVMFRVRGGWPLRAGFYAAALLTYVWMLSAALLKQTTGPFGS